MSTEFRKELEALINSHSLENGSNTPDFILANFLMGCLAGFDKAVQDRESWYGRISSSTDLEADAAKILRSMGVNPGPSPVRPENDDDE